MKNRSKKININTTQLFSKLISGGAYLLVVITLLLLVYLSFIDTLKLASNWRTATLFSVASVFMSWLIWNTFYHKQYEKTMIDDEIKAKHNEYSIHFRYYMASKDWTESDLQIAIDKFNDEYTAKWLKWVEKVTGVPIKTRKQKVIDPDTNKEKIVEVKGIEDSPYRGFHYKRLMWRIKRHKYPKSGYTTSREVLCLLSSEESNFKERKLHADKKFYTIHSIDKLLVSILTIVVGASISIEFLHGNFAEASLKLIIGVCAILSSVFFGAFNGNKGANLKLLTIEAVSVDLEKWANTKPIIEPYVEPVHEEPIHEEPKNPELKPTVTADIFSKLNIPKE